jgi:hypothetical protein
MTEITRISGGSQSVLPFGGVVIEATETACTQSDLERTELLHSSATELHGDTEKRRLTALRDRHRELQNKEGAKEPRALLAYLSEMGFAWRDIARLVGVSVPAVQKWRRGASISGINRFRLSKVAALVRLAQDGYLKEPASWLEMPLEDGVAMTGLDLLVADRFDLVLELMTLDAEPRRVLDEFDPDWRERFTDSVYEAFVAHDGQISLRMKDGAGATIPS